MSLNGTLSIGGSLNVQLGGNLSLTSLARVTVGGAISLNGTLQLQDGAVLSSSSQLVLGASSNAVVIQRPAPGVSSVSIPVVSYASINGSFASVSAQTAYSDLCVVSAVPSYGASSLSVTVTLQPCPSSLSPGAIAGIVEGSVIVGVALAIGIILLSRYLIGKYTQKAKASIALKEVQQVQQVYL